MRRITALWESLFSKDLYSEAFYSWKGIGFLTLLILIVAQTIIISAKIHLSLYAFAQHEAPPVVKQVPTITFKDGKASTPEPVAYEIKDPQNGQLIAIIDTRLPHPPADLGGALIYIAQESVMVKKSDFEQRSYEYSSMKDVVVDQKFIDHWLNVIAGWGAVVCAPFILIFLLAWRLFLLLLFSLVTLIVSSILGLRGSYAAKLRLTAIALVPAILLGTVMSLLSWDFWGYSLVFAGIVIGYIIYGANAAKATAVATVSDSDFPTSQPQ